MKYCEHCGAQIDDEAVFCVHCGKQVEASSSVVNSRGIIIAIKVFLILGCLSGVTGLLNPIEGLPSWSRVVSALIPLAWCIPITIIIFRRLDNGEPISIGLKVCTLLLVNLVAGILLFVLKECAPTTYQGTTVNQSKETPFDELNNPGSSDDKKF